jgi:hypothetical protein
VFVLKRFIDRWKRNSCFSILWFPVVLWDDARFVRAADDPRGRATYGRTFLPSLPRSVPMSRALAHLAVHLMTQHPSESPGARPRRRKIAAPQPSRQPPERRDAPPGTRQRD